MMHRIRKSMADKDQGFTLIELLVVIIIIGILAAIAIPIFLNQRKKAVDASMKADLKNAATSAEAFITDNPTSTTPMTIANLTTAGFTKSPGNTFAITNAGGPAGPYKIEAKNAGATNGTQCLSYDSSTGALSTWAACGTGAFS